MEKTKCDGYKLLLGRFQLESRRLFFTMRTVRDLNNLLREAVDSPTLDSFKAQLDRVLGDFMQTRLPPRNTRLDDPWGPFQSVIL